MRDIAEQHVIQDLGFIPSVQQYLDHMTFADWMGGKKKKKFTIQLKAEVRLEGEDHLTKDQFEALSKHWEEEHTLGKQASMHSVILRRYSQAGPEDLWGERSKLWKEMIPVSQAEKEARELFEDTYTAGL